jgi:AcrR family transcriptional regulator
MAENDDNKHKIAQAAHDLFMKYGIRSVSMDDIARHLGMSKKTIYQSFSEKDEIVTAVTTMHQSEWEEKASHLAATSANAIEELLRFSVVFREQMRQMNPSLMFDLFKYHRQAWDEWIAYKSRVIKQNVADTIRRGVAEGYFRRDLNPNILATFRVEQVEMAFNETIFPQDQYNFHEVQMQLFDHFIYGCLTRKGMDLYEESKIKLLETEQTPSVK